MMLQKYHQGFYNVHLGMEVSSTQKKHSDTDHCVAEFTVFLQLLLTPFYPYSADLYTITIFLCMYNIPFHPHSPLQISHAMLMPSVDFRDSESLDFQVHFVVCGGLKLLLSFLTNKKLLADSGTVMKRFLHFLGQFCAPIFMLPSVGI